jgi:hypothetical protein
MDIVYLRRNICRHLQAPPQHVLENTLEVSYSSSIIQQPLPEPELHDISNDSRRLDASEDEQKALKFAMTDLRSEQREL